MVSGVRNSDSHGSALINEPRGGKYILGFFPPITICVGAKRRPCLQAHAVATVYVSLIHFMHDPVVRVGGNASLSSIPAIREYLRVIPSPSPWTVSNALVLSSIACFRVCLAYDAFYTTFSQFKCCKIHLNRNVDRHAEISRH